MKKKKLTLKDLKISLGQIQVITGDLEGNTNRVLDAIAHAKKSGTDIIVFPETCITGYCCGSLFDNPKFIKDQEQKIYSKIIPETEGIVVILGCVINTGNNPLGFPHLTNSALVIQNKSIEMVYDKTYPAKYDHHEDLKYFNFKHHPEELNNTVKLKIKGVKVRLATLICEDIWNEDKPVNLVAITRNKYNADLLCVLNQSYFYYGKDKIRERMIKKHSTHYHLPIAWVNAVGIGDIVKNVVIYDGGSLYVSPTSKLIYKAPNFEPFVGNVSELVSTAAVTRPTIKYKEILDALIFEQKEMFNLIHIKNAQVHLSGGIDSALVAYICVKAMGVNNCVFITNPSKNNEAKLFGLAFQLCENLGVSSLMVQSIKESYPTILSSIKIGTPDEYYKKIDEDKLFQSTVQATLRSCYGLADTHLFNSGIVATGNHTEIVEGWANFHDIGSIGVHSIIGDLTKVEIFELCKYINDTEGKEIIPEELYNGKVLPAAELVDASVDPFDYFVRSGIDAEMIRERKSIEQLVKEFKHKALKKELFPLDWNGKTVYEKYTVETFKQQVESAFANSRKSVFKAAQSAPVVIISPRSRGFSNRETLINYYKES